jgi:UDP-4-amino-4,6-dideoxy-N-acetyl-beta-L-altrosamine transaminase|tara:strand:+ start:1 stop:1104 length:1104 start_codon:yes stop_codon:yes gene_type:complete
MISYGKQSINQDDIDAVVDVLKSDFLTQGPKVVEFENDLANYCEAKYAKAVNNGTAALHLAYLAIGLEQGDIVWTTPNTFVATANAALYCGATVDFVDIDPKTYNLSIDYLKEKLIQAKKDNKLPKLVVPVHFAGQSCEMKAIWKLSKEYGFKVIEDACHALGGEYLNNKVGNCEYSDMAVFSFHPVKMITTGEGGAITTNNEKLNEKIELLRSHGIAKDATKFDNQSDGDWYYEQRALGFNYRLTDIQAALGISQLKRLDSFVARRREIVKQYFDKLDNSVLPYQHPDANSSWHLFVIQTEDRKATYKQLKTQGIMTQVHYIPVTSQPFYNRKKLKNSADFYRHCLSLPIYADLNNNEQNRVINLL